MEEPPFELTINAQDLVKCIQSQVDFEMDKAVRLAEQYATRIEQDARTRQQHQQQQKQQEEEEEEKKKRH